MREIKFRARWVDTLEVVDDFEYEYLISAISDDNFIVEQYTGLMDKNGVEIYEGDIVKATMVLANGNTYETVGSITFHEGSFKLGNYPLANYIGCEEVIGNIHENADLLK